MTEQKNMSAQMDDDPEVQDPGRTEFANIAENLKAMAEGLRKMKELNPQTLRMHLLNDLYPLLQDFADTSNWYTGDLHARVSEVEDDEEASEGLDPEFAEQLIEFIGVSLQLFGVLVNLCKKDPEVIGKVQLLIAQAPGIIAKIRDITLEEDDEEEGEGDDNEGDDEEPEVLEPKPRQATSSVSAAAVPVLVESVEMVSPVVPQGSATAESNPDAPIAPTTAAPDHGVLGGSTTGGVESGNG